MMMSESRDGSNRSHCCECCNSEDLVTVLTETLVVAATVYDLNRPGEAYDAAEALLTEAFKTQARRLTPPLGMGSFPKL
jgi:hypothetical protein